jgi:hypothetical protein
MEGNFMGNVSGRGFELELFDSVEFLNKRLNEWGSFGARVFLEFFFVFVNVDF